MQRQSFLILAFTFFILKTHKFTHTSDLKHTGFQSGIITVAHQLDKLSNTEYVESKAARFNTERHILYLSMEEIFTSSLADRQPSLAFLHYQHWHTEQSRYMCRHKPTTYHCYYNVLISSRSRTVFPQKVTPMTLSYSLQN